MLTATILGAAGSRLRDRIVGLGCKVVVVVVVGWMRPKPHYHTTAAMTPVVRAGLCHEVPELC